MLWAEMAIMIAFDEGGGYRDLGYIQPLDFFGDGTRIPLFAVPPFALGGRIVHNYYGDVSILKFIERNWCLRPSTERSRDNLPNSVAAAGNPYVAANSAAIGDLFSMFRCDSSRSRVHIADPGKRCSIRPCDAVRGNSRE